MQSKNIYFVLYKKLIGLYPKRFKEQFNESMQQTFNDVYKEKQNTNQSLFIFTTWIFFETAIGIFQEHLLYGDIMQTTLKRFGSSGLISFLLIIPFLIMEIVNRRNFNEDFPYVLFFALWLNTLAVILILMPIIRSRWSGKHEITNPEQRTTFLTNPKSTLIISFVLIFFIAILYLLSSIGWEPLDRLFNGPNPEVTYIPGLFFTIILISIPIAAGIIAGRPIINTMQAGGSLFAHPIHLIIVVVLSFLFASGVVSLIIDQWPCFIGVPLCD